MNYSNEAISYVYEIVKTVEVALACNRTFRLEVVKVEKGANIDFDVHYYERQTLYKAPNGTITANPITSSAPDFYAWVPDNDLPSVNPQSSSEAALQQALNWLAERRNNENIEW